jgi:hypothetical protein
MGMKMKYSEKEDEHEISEIKVNANLNEEYYLRIDYSPIIFLKFVNF